MKENILGVLFIVLYCLVMYFLVVFSIYDYDYFLDYFRKEENRKTGKDKEV